MNMDARYIANSVFLTKTAPGLPGNLPRFHPLDHPAPPAYQNDLRLFRILACTARALTRVMQGRLYLHSELLASRVQAFFDRRQRDLEEGTHFGVGEVAAIEQHRH